MEVFEFIYCVVYGVGIGLFVGIWLEGKYGDKLRRRLKLRKKNRYIACYNRQISLSDSKSWNCYGAEFTATLKDCANCPYLSERMKLK